MPSPLIFSPVECVANAVIDPGYSFARHVDAYPENADPICERDGGKEPQPPAPPPRGVANIRRRRRAREIDRETRKRGAKVAAGQEMHG